MQEFVTGFNRLSQETKEIKALLQTLLKLTKVRLLKDEWLDAKEINASLHISQRTLKRLRDTGQLPYTQLFDKKPLYKYSDLMALLESNYFKNHPIKNK